MSTSGHDFIDNLINSVTKREQKNNNNVIRPALVPDIVPEPFISTYGNLNLGKQSSIVPRHSLEEDVDYENSAPDFRNYHEFSSNNQDHAPHESDSESNTIVTKTMATPGSDVGVGRIDEPPNTLSSSSPSSSPEEIKKHEESADGNNDFDAANQINNSSSRVENNDEGDFEVKNTQEESQSKPSSYFSSSEDLEINHSKRTVKEILKKSDAINREMVDNDINNIRDNRNRLIRENKNDATKVSRIYSNHADLKNKKNDTSKENGVGDNAHLPSTVGRITDNLSSKIIRNPIANFDITKEAYSQSDLDSTTRDYHRQQQNNKNAVNVKSTFTSAEKDPKNFEKLADENYYHHHNLPHSVTSNIKASSSSNREEPIITIHIGRIEVRAVSPLDSEEGNDYYNDSQTQRQSTAFQNHFQRLSLSDYLKQRAEGKI